MKYSILTVLVFLSFVAIAQSPEVIEIDSNTFEPSKSLPFDKRFILRVPINKSDSVPFIAIIKHHFRKDLDSTLYYEVKKKSSFQIKVIDPVFYSIKKSEKGNMLQIDFRDSLVLDPSKHYSILFSTGIGEEIINIFEKYHSILINGNPNIIKELIDFIANITNPFAEKAKSKSGAYQGLVPVKDVNNLPLNVGSIRDSLGIIDTNYKNILPILTNRDLKSNILTSLIKSSTFYNSFVNNKEVLNYLKFLSKSEKTFEIEYKKTLIAQKEQTQLLYNLFQSNQSTFEDILSGLKNLNCLDCKPLKVSQMPSRIDNLKKSNTSLKEIGNVILSLNQNDNTFSNLYTSINSFNIEIQNSLKYLNEISELNSNIAKKLSEDRNLHTIQVISGNSYVLGFETRNKFAITPDFGLLTTVSPPKDFKQYPMLIPYLGFHVNFRYVDKDQNFWNFPNNHVRPMRFLSAFVGWSLKSVEQQDKGITNFYNSSSLITGLGFRVGNFGRITYSKLFYYQKGANSTGSSLKNFDLIGFSLDAGIKDLLNGLKIFFPN